MTFIKITDPKPLRLNKHKVKIIIDANPAILRATLTLARHFQVDFNFANSINTVLGSDRVSDGYTEGEQIVNIISINTVLGSDRVSDGFTEGEQIVNIISINSILVNSDIIHGSYVNDTQQSTIYSFFPGPGLKIIKNPKNLVY